MPAQYVIDTDNHIVRLTFSGALTYGEIAMHWKRLRADRAFDRGFSELITFAEDIDIQLHFLDLLELLPLDPFSSSSKRAFVVSAQSAAYGIARIYQTIKGDSPYIRTFETTDAALSWLTARAYYAG